MREKLSRKYFIKSLQGLSEQEGLISLWKGWFLVELKAITELQDVHLAQVLNYLKAYKLEVALLINFGSKSLTFKRLVL